MTKKRKQAFQPLPFDACFYFFLDITILLMAYPDTFHLSKQFFQISSIYLENDNSINFLSALILFLEVNWGCITLLTSEYD